MNENTVSVAWIRGMVEAFARGGLDPGAVFAEAGLDIAELDNPEVRFGPDTLTLLWEVARERSGNPAIGLLAPEASAPVCFDAIAYSMMSSPNLQAGLERMLRYTRIVSGAAELLLEKEEQGIAVTVELAAGKRPVPRQRIEFVVVTILNFCRWLLADRLRPLEVWLTHPAPCDLTPYEELFGCPLRFEAPIHRILLSYADLQRPLPTANPKLAEVHDQHAAQYLDRIEGEKVASRARELILRLLPEGEPSRADVARALCTSERTLQRRLQQEGTSYHILLDETRKSLAQQYLRRHDLTLVQIAYLLGFADHSSFSRACKRWFDASPGEYRSR